MTRWWLLASLVVSPVGLARLSLLLDSDSILGGWRAWVGRRALADKKLSSFVFALLECEWCTTLHVSMWVVGPLVGGLVVDGGWLRLAALVVSVVLWVATLGFLGLVVRVGLVPWVLRGVRRESDGRSGLSGVFRVAQTREVADGVVLALEPVDDSAQGLTPRVVGCSVIDVGVPVLTGEGWTSYG